MDLEIYLNNAEACLAKVEHKYCETLKIDYDQLLKFKNIIECLPGIEKNQEFEGELLRQVEHLLYNNRSWRSQSSTVKKLHLIIDLFFIVKAEYEDVSGQKDSKSENIFLTICTVLFTMLMFLP